MKKILDTIEMKDQSQRFLLEMHIFATQTLLGLLVVVMYTVPCVKMLEHGL